MTRAINPQIMKSEGCGNRQRMIRVCEIGSKYSSFLFTLFGVPVAMEADFLFELWLKEVPRYAVIFCQLIMTQMLIEKFTFQITHAIRAVGNIRNFQITESIVCVVYLPFAYLLFKFGYSPVIIYLLGSLNSCLVAGVRLYYGKHIASINISQFITSSVLPVLIPLTISLGVYFVIKGFLIQNLFTIAIKIVLFCILFTILFYVIGMNSEERIKWHNIIREIFQ